MGYYVRKISLSKWPKPPSFEEFDIHSLRADAIADIRTIDDSLSLWSIPSESSADINEAVLALATSINQSSFDKIDVVVFSDEDILANGFQLEIAEGDTAVTDLKCTHRNIVGLTYDSLTNVIKMISKKTIAGHQIRRNKRAIETLIKDNLGRINISEFSNESIKEKILSLAGITTLSSH